MAAPAAVTVSSLHCTICGDDASAFNFGVLSCESCKAFFRRATRSSKVPTCVFSGDCVMSLLTRRFCAACRLRKCLTAGMNKRLVLSVEQRRERQQSIDDNRLRKGTTHAGRLRLGHAAQRALCQPTARPPYASRDRHLATIRALPVAAVDKKTSELLLLLSPQSSQRSVPSPTSLPSELQLQQQSDQVDVVRSKPVGSWDRCGGSTLATAVGVAAPSSINSTSSERALPPPDGLLAQGLSLEMRCSVSWSLWSHQQPTTAAAACPDGGSTVCLDETALSRLPEQVQLAAASVASPFSRRHLSTQASDALNVLTALYKSKLAASRRLSFRRSMDIDVTAMSGLLWGRDAYRANRQQQFAARASDLVSGYVLFARELPDVARLPVAAQMALVKACAPTFILVRAVELYNEERAALIDEQGDVVPTAVIDDLLSQSGLEPEVALPSGPASRCRRFFEVVSTIKRLLPTSGPGGSPDRAAIALLQAIALLSPELMPPNVVSQDELDTLANAQQRHVFLLRQHLEATCSFEEAALLWPKLMVALEASKRDAFDMSDLLLSCDAVRRDELLAEILDALPGSRMAAFSNAACATGKWPALPPLWTDARSDPDLPLQIVSGANEQELGSLSSTCAPIDIAQSFGIFSGNMAGY